MSDREWRNDTGFFRTVFESVREGVVVQQIDGAIVACNHAATQILGLDEDQLTGRTSMDPRWKAIRDDGSPYPGEDHPSMITLATGNPIEGAIMGVDAPGRGLRWISINTQPLFHEGGDKPYAVIASFADITQLKRAHEELHTSDTRLQLALSSARAGVWEWNIGDQSIYWSPEAEALFGLQPGEFGGTFAAYTELLHPEDRDHVLDAIQRALADPVFGCEFRVEHRILLSDDSVRWLGGAGKVERNSAGEPVMMRGVVTDITHRKQLEDQQLHTTKMESIGVLAGGVAHDFNNLLTAIMTSVDAASRSAAISDERVTRMLEIASDATTRAANLTHQLLTFAHKQPVSERQCEVDALIRGMRPLLQSLVGDAIELDYCLAAQHSHVRADLHQLEQLLVNLSVNAQEAMPAGGSLRIATRETSTDRDWVELVVTDDGVGIDPQQLKRIFDPYFTTKQSGSGLGLATCYGIVTRMGGTITCESQPGAGTSFRVRLPRFSDRRTAIVPATDTTHAADGQRILLVDDNELALRALARGLRARGFDVIATSAPEEALAVVDSAEPIDIVVSDVVMATIRGPELVGRIRHTRPHLPALFISGYTADALEQRDLGDNDDLLLKPFPTDVLAASVLRMLSRAPTPEHGTNQESSEIHLP